jgi:hypothetical protein
LNLTPTRSAPAPSDARYAAVFDLGLSIEDKAFFTNAKLDRGVTETLLRSRRAKVTTQSSDPLKAAFSDLASRLGVELGYTSRANVLTARTPRRLDGQKPRLDADVQGFVTGSRAVARCASARIL